MKKYCKIFNTYFTNINKGLKLWQVDKTQSFENKESCRLIKEHFGNEIFSIMLVSKNEFFTTIRKLPWNKASISNDIAVSKMKKFANCYGEKITNILNDYLKQNRFPILMKAAEINIVFEKLENTSKDNHWPMST